MTVHEQDVVGAAAITRAMELGDSVRGQTSPNPPVGAVVYTSDGTIVGEGATAPVGGDHAEVSALRAAGERAQGATVAVTLEPCNHTGHTGPCTQALINAGVARVVVLHSDPNPIAAGGAEVLRAAGIDIVHLHGAVPEQAGHLSDALRPWLAAIQLGRPHVTVKFAQTLDGYIAAADGTSKWITGESAREYVHEDRARRDAIIVGTGTALADDPRLTARTFDGSLFPHQPRRVVIGSRSLPPGSNLEKLGFIQYGSISQALDELWSDGARDVLVEGGAGLSSAMLNQGFVDSLQVYIAPMLLGAGQKVLAHPVTHTLADAPRFQQEHVVLLGDDVLVEYSAAESA
ncbi:bifunctional diaminohydroxyphosphoribosylaminopyrimidine deaminase/5-amino-6-(5-phosphoribosylamino)uracil reductase RibD [Corynebacterium incognita]|uniref:Riboflavin biosynthesis protein RibD n=1 Tax=Corynebacterium incognita TaxID=2754725 RepID=A0A7G7CPU8_9CORY|nr:bifunctional diaminohydroxyphosphoribosylaminopyrimidine deaminase/5-amino-6-(5-phosphoribosylamino)uracil reductase RibD [Corynebacterium incognita]QNE89614.1 bifunctional diaminohydroxyphosphoribosylaminopyrimidine deaminase/5-amino-6-(5-phosphoribosylamino)uracil reductase RibD [Corynebacterium incognita]